jgi:hypothetical protein
LFRKLRERLAGLATGGKLDDTLERGVALTTDYFQFGHGQVVGKELPQRRARFDSMMLSTNSRIRPCAKFALISCTILLARTSSTSCPISRQIVRSSIGCAQKITITTPL